MNAALAIEIKPKKCKHCSGSSPENTHRRDLCRGCYDNREVRALYPRKKNVGLGSPSVLSGKLDLRPKGLPLPLPTRAVPGSPQKLSVLAVRAALKQQLWHPDDAKLETMRDSDFSDAADTINDDWLPFWMRPRLFKPPEE